MRVRLKHERLAEELARRPLSLNGWARRLGLTSGHLSQLANGKRPRPNASTREKLLQGLELEFEDLFEVESTPADPPSTRPRPSFSERGAAMPRPRARQGVTARSGGKERSVQQLISEFRFAVRSLSRRPGFTLAAAATLAIGIGANVALFTAFNAMLLKAYPYEAPERLFHVYSSDAERPGARLNFSWPDYLDFAERLDGVLQLAVWDWEPFSLAGGDRPQRVGGIQTTANFASVVGVEPLLGRFFTEEERAGEAEVLVLSEGLWRASFGADPAIVGREIVLNGAPATVVGVTRAELNAVDDASIYVPLRASLEPEMRGAHWLGSLGRLSDGVDRHVATRRLEGVAAELEAEYPRFNEGRGAGLLDLREARVGPVRTMFVLLLGVVLVVLLIVCANVANLMLSRGAARHQELALRRALGAGRSQLFRQLLAESAVLTLLGLTGGAALGVVGARSLLGLVPQERLPGWMDPSTDWRVFAYAVVVSALALFLFGVVPALRQSRGGLQVRSDGGNATVRRRSQAALVVAQVALCTVLLSGAGLLVRSLLELGSIDAGLGRENGLVVGLDLLALRAVEGELREQRFLDYYERFEAIPGVSSVGVIDRLPLSGSRNQVGMTLETPGAGNGGGSAILSRVTAGYFEAAGLSLLQGSDFDLEAGYDRDRPLEVVVSRKFADTYWPESNPLGQRLKFGYPDDDEPWFTIGGVVSDVRHRGLERELDSIVYLTSSSVGMTRAQWVLRGESSSQVLAGQVRSAVAEIDPNQPVWGVRSLDDHVEASLWEQRFFTTLFWFFGVVACALAAIGLYGVLAHSVALRRFEIGVRLALGSTAAGAARLVVGEGLRWVAWGLLLGLPLAYLLGRALSGFLFGVMPLDPPVWIAVVLLLAAVGSLAAALPARRASRLDPAETLRAE